MKLIARLLSVMKTLNVERIFRRLYNVFMGRQYLNWACSLSSYVIRLVICISWSGSAISYWGRDWDFGICMGRRAPGVFSR